MQEQKKLYSFCAQKLYRNVVIGKFGSFLANELIGQPYGLTYEIVDKRLEYLPPRTLEQVGMCKPFPFCCFLEFLCMTEDTDATNELINDGEFVQPLTVDDIQALKQSGVHASVCKDFLSLLYISL